MPGPATKNKPWTRKKIVSKGQFNLILKFKCSKKFFFQNSKMRFFSCHKCRRREKESIAFIHTQFNIPPLLPRPGVCFALHHFLVSSKREGNKEDGFYKRGALCNSSLKAKSFTNSVTRQKLTLPQNPTFSFFLSNDPTKNTTHRIVAKFSLT